MFSLSLSINQCECTINVQIQRYNSFESWSVQRSIFLAKNNNRQALCLGGHIEVASMGPGRNHRT